MKVLKEVLWIRKKINAAIRELSSAIEQSKTATENLKARMRLAVIPFKNHENTPEAQEIEMHMQKIYVFQVTIGGLYKLLELIEEYSDGEKIEVDTGEDKAWLMSTVDENEI